MMEIVGIWVGAFLTLCIYSFLYKDNPFYKFAEHIFVGSSSAYMFALAYYRGIKPLLIEQLTIKNPTTWHWLIPGVLGFFMILRIFPKVSWLSRWGIAFSTGLGAGIGIRAGIHGYILPQLKGTLVPLVKKVNSFLGIEVGKGVGYLLGTINQIILVTGVITTVLYFFFSKEHKGKITGFIRVGKIFIMIAFGASFGYTVMARVSLLIGRIMFLLKDWLKVIE